MECNVCIVYGVSTNLDEVNTKYGIDLGDDRYEDLLDKFEVGEFCICVDWDSGCVIMGIGAYRHSFGYDEVFPFMLDDVDKWGVILAASNDLGIDIAPDDIGVTVLPVYV